MAGKVGDLVGCEGIGVLDGDVEFLGVSGDGLGACGYGVGCSAAGGC